MRTFATVSLAFLVLAFAVLASGQTLLSGLRAGHPRLIATSDQWENLKVRRQSDPQLAAFLTMLENEAREILTRPTTEYQKIGRRILMVSREVERRTLLLALTYRTTGDAAFLRRAEREMIAATEFTDWNPSHFLDVGEMTAGLALGYDWLYDALSPEARGLIRTAIVDKGLRTALDSAAKHNGWQKADNNWNQVCFGGLILGALAVADEEPEIAEKILALARPRLANGLKTYAPDGVFPEGPAYWSYGTSYSVLTIAALETALGEDWGISKNPGFLASAAFVLQTTAPSGGWFNYADTPEAGSIEPALLWFAARVRNPWIAETQMTALGKHIERGGSARGIGEATRFLPFAALWWPADIKTGAQSLPLRWHGDGENPVAVFRSRWDDPKAFYLGIKGGVANLSHAHMDAGSFILEADGVRWARDLGRQEYHSLESKGIDLWNRAQDSQRWQVFRLNNWSHNTLTLGGALHRVDGHARITSFSGEGMEPFALVDLAAVFPGQVTKTLRGFKVFSDRAVLVQDELAGLKPGSPVRWTMATGADVSVAADGRRATLSEAGRTCEVRLLGPVSADVRLKVISADPPADGFNAANPGRSFLVVETTAPADGNLTLAVWLAPGAKQDEPAPEVRPLASWTTVAVSAVH